jgi:hypothetical protein
VFPWPGAANGRVYESETFMCGNLAPFTSYPSLLVSVYGPRGVEFDPDPHNLLGGAILSMAFASQDILYWRFCRGRGDGQIICSDAF